jgi:hypothetical protein
MVPELIRDQFWLVRDNIRAFSIAVADDIIPWELLYPMAQSHDNGFLVEQFPVMRRVYGQQRFRSFTVGGTRYVMPSGSPTDAGGGEAMEVSDTGVAVDDPARTRSASPAPRPPIPAGTCATIIDRCAHREPCIRQAVRVCGSSARLGTQTTASSASTSSASHRPTSVLPDPHGITSTARPPAPT